jgi:hypothetical protein
MTPGLTGNWDFEDVACLACSEDATALPWYGNPSRSMRLEHCGKILRREPIDSNAPQRDSRIRPRWLFDRLLSGRACRDQKNAIHGPLSLSVP